VICEEDLPDGLADHADAQVVRQLQRTARAVTSTVREQERALIILLHVNGVSVETVAGVLDATAKRVSTWLPAKALVLSCDEKSQYQALERTKRSPIGPDRMRRDLSMPRGVALPKANRGRGKRK
jgi:hypothetical protein